MQLRRLWGQSVRFRIARMQRSGIMRAFGCPARGRVQVAVATLTCLVRGCRWLGDADGGASPSTLPPRPETGAPLLEPGPGGIGSKERATA